MLGAGSVLYENNVKKNSTNGGYKNEKHFKTSFLRSKMFLEKSVKFKIPKVLNPKFSTSSY